MLNRDKLLLDLQTSLKQWAPLSEDAWRAFEGKAQLHRFKKRDYIFQANRPGSRMHFLRSGLVRLFYLQEQGKEINKSFIKPDDVIGSIEQAFYNRSPTFSAQCLTDCITFSLAYDSVHQLTETFEYWDRFVKTVMQQLALKKQRREQQLLTQNATQCYEQFLQQFGPMAEEIPLYQIASYLGITDVALSRIRRRLNLI